MATYVFTRNKKTEKRIIESVRFGGGCINNMVLHLASAQMPFGGVGYSGVGYYHGKYSFDAFTHEKSILKTATFYDDVMKYPSDNKMKMKIVKLIFR